MAGYGAFTTTATGAVTKPATALSLIVGSAMTPDIRDYGPGDFIYEPSLKAAFHANGIDFQYHFRNDVAFLTGMIAPHTAETLASTGVRATATWISGNGATTDIANNDTLSLGNATTTSGIKFVTTLTPGATVWEVKRGTSLADTVSNFTKMVNGTGTDGIEYTIVTLFGVKQANDYWYEGQRIEVTGSTGTTTVTTTLRDRDYGTGGNSFHITEGTDSGGTWSVTAWTGGSTGTGSAPAAGTYTGGYAYDRSGDFGQTAVSPTVDVSQDANNNLSVSGFTAAPTRIGSSFFRVFRTTESGSVFYRVTDTTADPYTDSASDDALRTAGFQILYKADDFRPYSAGYMDRYRCHTMFGGSIIGAGAIPARRFADGTINVTNGVMTAAISAGNKPTVPMIGREIRITADGDVYVITDVTESTRTLRFNRPYAGATNATASYEILDARDPCEVFWSVEGLPNQWPVTRSERGIQSPDPAGVVAIRAAFDSAIAFTRTGVWRLTGTPATGFAISPIGEGMGAFNQSCVLSIEGGLYWIGPDGVFFYTGSGVPECISKPRRTKRGIQGTVEAINNEYADNFVGNFNPSLRIARWWVALDNDPYNNSVIVLDLQTGSFTLDTAEAVTSATTLVGPDGTYVTLTGDAFGSIWQMDTTPAVDGLYAVEPKDTISAQSGLVTTITTSTYSTSSGGLVGLPVYQITAAGVVQRNIIASNTATTFTVLTPWSSTPATSTTVLVGAIFMRIKTSKFDFGLPECRKTVSSVRASFIPDTLGQRLWCAVGTEQTDPTVFNLRSTVASDYATLTESDGEYLFWFRRGNARRLQVEWFTFVMGNSPQLLSLTPAVRIPDVENETVE